jgi:hypothetical protein
MSKISDLNDALRTTLSGGRVLLTAGVDALAAAEKAAVISKIRTFADFNSDNDPHGEHDFASVVVDGQTYFAKIDYYAPDMQSGSEDPANPEKTVRVLTIMRADEY